MAQPSGAADAGKLQPGAQGIHHIHQHRLGGAGQGTPQRPHVGEDNVVLFFGQGGFHDGQLDQSGTDVMSYSFYSGNFNDDSKGVNSAGKSLTGGARNTMQCPSFVAPAKPGDYRIRFKMDWNSVDAGGQMAADGTCTGNNGILANGGAIIDATLRVTKGTGIVHATRNTPPATEVYDLQGRSLSGTLQKGIYIQNHRKIIK